QTGALTARARAGGGETPGFTSKFGKPAIAMTPLAPPATPPAAATASQHRLPLLVVAAISLLVALLALATLPRAFPELNQALVWAPSVVVAAPRAGTIVTVPVRVGDQVATGQELLVLGNAAVSAEREGTVARLCVSAGAVVAAGEPLLELADQRELRIVVALPEPEAAAQGERVRVRLLGEDRVLHGAVESVLPPSSSGFWNGVGTPPLRAVIVLDAGLVPPRLGQGARVVVLGTGPLRPLLLALRDTLPW
ncbi:MAG TPA: hypothetical protein DCS97_10790, partial [Planctomycetes bacterium]|nr:hypothetical protein [Planctomycetota bacterium]